jgi:hypothetical protein
MNKLPSSHPVIDVAMASGGNWLKQHDRGHKMGKPKPLPTGPDFDSDNDDDDDHYPPGHLVSDS